LLSIGKRRVQQLRANEHPNATLYGEDEMGGLHTLYVLTDRASVFGLPEAPQLATSSAWAQWLSGAITAGVLSVIPFWFLYKRRNQIEAEQESRVEGGTR
jgi:formate dehydrogenase iron-sulfur subunit